ncbi:hypothetical protein [Acinetobacter proteolyticus]|uniref:hypothetical protein n=1 Tax=Acinetobacter proteolyticus TaxID=1776741 RepID=UPI0031E27A5C
MEQNLFQAASEYSNFNGLWNWPRASFLLGGDVLVAVSTALMRYKKKLLVFKKSG